MIQENQRLIRAGASLHPLHPKSKRPVDLEWSTAPRQGLVALNKRFEGSTFNIGIRLGEPSKLPEGFLMALDMDIHDEQGEAEAEAWAEAEHVFGAGIHEFPRQKSGSAGASVHLFFVCDEPFRYKKVAKSDRIIKRANGKTGPAWEIELFGTGKQIATAPSIHPDTGNPYRWIIPLTPRNMPSIDAEVVASVVYSEEPDQLNEDRVGLSFDAVQDFIRRLPDWRANDRGDWIDVGMAIKHELGADGLPIFVEFSKRDLEKYNKPDENGTPGPKVVREQYKSVRNRKSRGRLITMRTLIAEVLDHEREESMRTVADEFEDLEDDAGPPSMSLREIQNAFDDLDEPVPLTDKPKPRAGDPDMTILGAGATDAPEYDWEALFGPNVTPMLRDLSVALKCPMDYVVAAYLWAIAATIGNSLVIRIDDTFVQPSVFFGMIIGGPSSGKSAPLAFFSKILTKIEGMHRGVWQNAHERWKDEADIAKDMEKDWKLAVKTARRAGEEAPAKPAGATPPPEPHKPTILTNDATPEALGIEHKRTPRGVSILRQELNVFFNRMMNSYTGSNDRGRYLEAYDADESKINRAKNNGEEMIVKRFAISIIGGIQPDILLSIGGPKMADDGLIARFVTFWAKRTPRDFTAKAPSHEDRFFQMFSRIYEDLRMVEDKSDPTGLRPDEIVVDARAAEFLADWSTKRDAREKAAMPRLEGVFGKAGGLIPRMALWAHISRWSFDPFDDDLGKISLAEIKESIRWREVYAKPQQLRVFQHTMETEERKQARKVAEWIIDQKPPAVNASKLRREAGIEGFTSATRAQEMDEVIQFLVHLRWLYPIEDKKPQGGRPSKSYGVNERVYELLD